MADYIFEHLRRPTVFTEIPRVDGFSSVRIQDEMIEYLTEDDKPFWKLVDEIRKGANEMNQKFIDDNGVTIYGYKPEAVVKAEKKREGKAEKLLKHLTEDEINYVKANPAILDALGKQASNPLYKRASKEMARTKAEQLVKASEKYPEPLNPESWTGEQLADHAFQEVFDLTSYITGMKIKFEKQDDTLCKLHDKIDALTYALEYREKAHQATIRQAQYWKKERLNLEINFENVLNKKKEAETDFVKCEQAYDELHDKHEKLQKDFRILERNYEDRIEDLNFIAKQKTELINSNHRVAETNAKLKKEINQLYADNKTLETCVKDLQVEAKLWEDKFHLLKPTLDEHDCNERATPIINMNVLEKLICGTCNKVLWSKDND